MFAKSSDKIIVDASKFLDPNFKRIVKRGKENPYGLTPGLSPYPYRRVPTPEACEEVHRILSEFHGEVKQPEKMPSASLEVAGCGEVPCVLDALLRTLISGNTLMAMADAAIKNLAQHYGLRTEGTGAGSINWDKVRLSSHQELVEVIKIAGNGPKKARHIKQILDMVYEENLQRAQGRPSLTKANPIQRGDGTCVATQNLLSLDHMHRMSKDEAMAKFVSYPGIGIKTAACVTLFCLRMPCFAVDTHVHKFCRWLGWVPAKADPDNCFRHGEVMVPDHLKYGLHQLFIRHGQQCFKCRKVTKPGTKEWDEAPDCPLEHLLDRSKDEAAAKPKRNGKVKEESDSEDASSGMED
ncbi:d2a410f9-7547-49b4-8ed0-89f924398cf2 [Thermothielavioides terrestris]|uniref:D2a410f9-7547-49b4-8ed0-89f924398cf2 n=1 Tax=Thermothielavioides terrestris TaxID=2587410 RepID=A0A446BAY2_9PEZI|nr:d2a410f9-7547-49b4-8ed0-89f924398cf2 [Thermothielavioides terrestris]